MKNKSVYFAEEKYKVNKYIKARIKGSHKIRKKKVCFPGFGAIISQSYMEGLSFNNQKTDRKLRKYADFSTK